MSDKQTAYSRGQEVSDEGIYVCVPCGYKHHYKKGETFGECISCLANSNTEGEEISEGLETWEKL